MSSRFSEVILDLGAFALGLGLAYFLSWEPSDLVWSLWLGSLVIGYLTILMTIAGGVFLGALAIRHEDFEKKYRLPAVLLGFVAVLFFFGFFSLHFCGFHAGHAFFLQHFFPLEEVAEEFSDAAFMNPVLLWGYVFGNLVKPYGLFIIPALIAERHRLLAPFRENWHVFQSYQRGEQWDGGEGVNQKDLKKDLFAAPYLNVVRMHCLIFFFGFCHFMKLDSFAIYAVVYAVYFFPWRVFKKEKEAQQT